jgi:hypothetical protein
MSVRADFLTPEGSWIVATGEVPMTIGTEPVGREAPSPFLPP